MSMVDIILGKFARALKVILRSEGGRVDDPHDPGGRTNMGVTQRVYNAERIKNNLPIRDVYLIDMTEVEAIYRFQYWEPIRGEQLPDGLDLGLFDGTVNSGAKQAVKWVQRAIGFEGKAVDGVLGTLTLQAIQAVNDVDALIGKMLDRRMIFLQALKTWKFYHAGWTNRINTIRETAQLWATGSVGAMPVHVFFKGENQKARPEDAITVPMKGIADTATGGGLASGGLGVAVDRLQETLTPYSVAGGWIEKLVVGLIILGAVLTISGLAWRWYSSRKHTQLRDALDPDVPVAA